MDHLVAPLDPDHVHAVDELVHSVAGAAEVKPALHRSDPHITLIAHAGLPAEQVAAAIAPVVAAARPFTVHAHGYGFFTGPERPDLNLHVPVVRSQRLDVLHRALCAALREAGGQIAGWSEPEVWSPHVTLLDRELDPTTLGTVAAWLASRRHPSWRIPVDCVAMIGGRPERRRAPVVFAFGGSGEQGSTSSCGQPSSR